MSEETCPFEVAYISTDELDPLGYPNRLQIRKAGNVMEHRSYRPDDWAFAQETKSGKVYCSCCRRQLRRVYLTRHNDGYNFCPRCGARIVGTEKA